MPPFLPIVWSHCYSSDGHRFTSFYHLDKRAARLNLILTIIGLFAAVAGMICLLRGSFSEDQFKHAVKFKVAFFSILVPLVVGFFFSARKCNDVLEKACRKHIHMKSVVKLVLLGCATTVNLLIKYPRFNVHSKYKRCSTEEQGKEISQGSRFNLYSAGSFSAFALVVSSKRTEAMELGIFDFLLGLTMDASMEINLLYMSVAFVYCALLIFIRNWLESLKVNGNISGARQGNIQDLRMVLIEGAGEEATVETEDFVIDHPVTQVCEETIVLFPITMPVWREIGILDPLDLATNGRAGTSLLPDWKKGRDISTSPVEEEEEEEEEECFVGTSYLVQGDLTLGLYCPPSKHLCISHLVKIDLQLSEFLHVFGDVVTDGVKFFSELFFQHWQMNNVWTDVGERNIFEIECERGEEQSCEIGEAFLDVVSREDTYLRDGLRKRRNDNRMKLEISNVVPGVFKDRLPNLQELHISDDYY